MLLTSVDHVAVLTADTDAFVAFFADVFGATSHPVPNMPPGMRLTFVDVGPGGRGLRPEPRRRARRLSPTRDALPPLPPDGHVGRFSRDCAAINARCAARGS
jgi:catechol 2,3-dioxygenase-like lactoylglutathione lyase family enzyme